jgi:hypothetical protein
MRRNMLLHIKITHFDSVASIVITKVASVAFCSQGRKCHMLLTSVASVKESILPWCLCRTYNDMRKTFETPQTSDLEEEK